MQPRIEAITRALLDRVAPRHHMEVLCEFAYQLPTLVMCDMLGVEESERTPERMSALSQAIADSFLVFETRAQRLGTEARRRSDGFSIRLFRRRVRASARGSARRSHQRARRAHRGWRQSFAAGADHRGGGDVRRRVRDDRAYDRKRSFDVAAQSFRMVTIGCGSLPRPERCGGSSPMRILASGELSNCAGGRSRLGHENLCRTESLVRGGCGEPGSRIRSRPG